MKTGWIRTAAGIAVCEAAGLISGALSASGTATWYPELKKPAWTPPAGIFGPVWIVLYALMGIAAADIWHRRKQPGGQAALWAFGGQLALNFAWSLLFFRWQRPWFAFFELLALLVAILVTIALFWRLSRRAALLLVPYLAWTGFAAALNGAIAALNP
jgi:tryptophan-rich sensory protein